MSRRWLPCIGVAVALASCGDAPDAGRLRSGPPCPSGHATHLLVPGAGGVAAIRVDGAVTHTAHAPPSWPLAWEFLFFTSDAGGADQHAVLAYDAGGRRVATWRPGAGGPYAVRQSQCPLPTTLHWFVREGAAWVVVATGGPSYPAAIHLLRATDAGLEESFAFWNPGVIERTALRGDLLAFQGVNNSMSDPAVVGYRPVVGILDLGQVIAAAGRGRTSGEAPRGRDHAGSGYLRYAALPLGVGASNPDLDDFRFESGVLRVSRSDGLAFALDAATGACRATASKAYAERHERERGADGPGIDAHLAEREAATLRWPE